MSPPTTSQTSIQNADLQDLQHQVSVKTFEFQTLQREYDALLQNLERQKTKCATFEKKLEVSGIEINSLKEEKERLLAQILTVEGQIEELQQSRDEARRQLVANGAQYVRIMDMANRLQSQSAEAKKIWELEKAGLEQRIRLLEEAMVAGTPKPTPTVVAEQQPGINSVPSSVDSTDTMNTTIPSQTEIINVLRSEISRLRSRTHTLESTVQNMRRESFSIQTVARKILDSGDKIGNIAKEVVGEDE
jgi:DNA repair exonuclease SbcCD ATPase subunit